MDVDSIADMLRGAIGLNPDSIGREIILRAVQSRMIAVNKATVAEYFQYLGDDSPEMKRLVEAVVIPETSFFRDRVPFTLLGDYAVEYVKKNPGKKLNVLSVPSSTGEEPYSIAMTLLERGLSQESFTIYAFEISEPLIRIASEAIYTDYSFRGCDNYYKEKYFTSENNAYCLSREVKDCVQFKQANIINDSLAASDHAYQAIFCRNLLIYFDREIKERVIRKLANAMTEDGILFVGYAETSLLSQLGFSRVTVEKSFAFCKSEETIPKVGSASAANTSILERGKEFVKQQQALRASMTKHHNNEEHPVQKGFVDRKSSYPSAGVNWHDLASDLTALYEKKEFSRLEQQCKTIIRIHGQESNLAYYYLGLLNMERGDAAEAEIYYKQSIYLDPNHYQTLMQLSALEARRGNKDSARRYHDRASRIIQRKNCHE